MQKWEGYLEVSMDNRVYCVILIIFSLALAQQAPVVKYLRGVPRLSNASLVDYYFSCNTLGETLQWQVNQDTIFGFTRGERTGNILTRTIPNIRYTATLLSSRLFQGVLYTFDSVLIASSIPDININVACMNGIETTPISSSTKSIERNEILNVIIPNILLQYLFSASILNTVTTYFYLCEVNDVFQAWQTNAQAFGFSNLDIIGAKRNFLTTDQTAAVQQAILIGNEPNSLVTVLLVTGIVGFNVTCDTSQFRATLFYSDLLSATTIPAPTTTTSDFDVTTDTTNTIRTTVISDQESRNNIVAIAVAVFLTALLGMVMIAAFSFWIKRKKNKNSCLRQPPQQQRSRHLSRSKVARQNKRPKMKPRSPSRDNRRRPSAPTTYMEYEATTKNDNNSLLSLLKKIQSKGSTPHK